MPLMLERLALRDRVLLLSFSALYAAAFLLYASDFVSGNHYAVYLHVHAASSEDTYPVITQVAQVPTLPVRGIDVGDQIVEIAGRSLRGAGRFETLVAAVSGASRVSDGSVPFRVLRGGQPRDVVVHVTESGATLILVIPLALGIAGVLAFLGGGGSTGSRFAFLASLAFGFHFMPFNGASPWVSSVGLATFVLGGVLLGPLSILAFLNFPEETARRGIAAWTLPWLFLINGLAYSSAIAGWPFDASLGVPLSMAGNLLVIGAAVWIIRGSWKRCGSAGRRQLLWIMLGVCIGLLPTLVASGFALYDPAYLVYFFATNISLFAVPVCFIVAIVAFGAFDLDRIVAAAVTFSVVVVALLLAVVALAPAFATWSGEWIGLPVESARIAVAVAVGLAVVPSVSLIRPRVFSFFFPARVALDRRIESSLAGLSDQASEGDLLEAVQRDFVSLFGARWIGMLDGAGRLRSSLSEAAPPELRSDDLVRLTEFDDPIRVERRGAGFRSGRGLAPEMQSRLEEAGVAVVVPVHVPQQEPFVILLGTKTSGDVYPPNDLRVLRDLSHQLTVEMLRIRSAHHAARSLVEQEANLARSKFLAATSHDLRQPLHAFGLHLGALSTEEMSPRAAHTVGQLGRALGELQDQFESVLQVSRLDAGVVAPEPRPMPLGPLLASLDEALRPTADARGLRLRVRPSAAWVESDPLLLVRILRNLAENAMRYTREGRVLIGARTRGRDVRIEIWDTGPGISEDEQSLIFQEFSRGRAGLAGEFESTDRESARGLGLGLSIVERLADLLGHRLGMRTEPGRGSVFWVDLPQAEGQGPAGRTPERTLDVQSELAGTLVLVVDDEPSILEGFEALLAAWDCEVLTATDGESAASALRSADRAPDLMVLDDQVGQERGPEIAHALCAQLSDEQQEPLLLFVTGSTDAMRLAELERQGLLVLSKPVAPIRLRAALSHLIATRA